MPEIFTSLQSNPELTKIIKIIFNYRSFNYYGHNLLESDKNNVFSFFITHQSEFEMANL